jgi:predicted porin
LAVTSAFAQSTVTLYGIVDVGHVTRTQEKADGTLHSRTAGISDGGQAGNRIGFKGTEDLGGGKTAGFVIESGMAPTSGQLLATRQATGGHQYAGLAADSSYGTTSGGGISTSTNRQTYVSLADKSLGEVRIGYQYTHLYEVSTLDGYMFGSENAGSAIAHTWGQAWTGGTRANGTQYIAPKMGNLTLSAQVGAASDGREMAEFADANAADGATMVKNKRSSFKAMYEQGPLKASLAYTSVSYAGSARAAATGSNYVNIFGATVTGTGAAAVLANAYESKLTQLGASYDFGAAKVGATYNTGNRNISAAASGTASAAKGSSVADWDVKSYNVGVSVPMGATSFFASTGKASYEAAGTKAFDITQSQYGVRYAMSKRTTVYGIMGSDKDTGAQIAANSTTTAAAAKRKFSAFGIAHAF